MNLRRSRVPVFVVFVSVLLPVGCSTPPSETLLTSTVDEPYRGFASADGWWGVLGDGTLRGWEPVDESPGALVEGETVILPATDNLNAVRWGGALPSVPYEIELEANRLDGNDIFCGLTFPVGDSSLSLILGGWNGQICGLSSLNHYDASDNETTTFYDFENERWYRVRVVVRSESITAWLDDERLVDVHTKGSILDTRLEMDGCKPLGLATWMTRGGFRNMRIRDLEEDEAVTR